jgi:hypothetical protein
MTELDRQRVDAIGATQARYLWALLILILFYGALQMRPVLEPAESVRVPVLDLKISSIVVLSSGPGVLSLIVMAIVGSMRALRRARKDGLAGRTGEEFDLHPNLIDLAFYAPPGSASLFVHLARTVYAILLTLGLAEAVWLVWHMLTRHMASGRLATFIVVVEVLGTLLLLRATWLVLGVWARSLRDYSTLYRR